MISKMYGKYTMFPTEMGWTGLVSTENGIFASVLPQNSLQKAETQLLTRIPFEPEYAPEYFKALEENLKAYFRGECREVKSPIDWSWATPFQKKALHIVLGIPAGTVMTYSEIAFLAGSPGGARAVGRALASNMIPVIIPCHRVIRKNGALGGFTGAGTDLKARMLLLEGMDLTLGLRAE